MKSILLISIFSLISLSFGAHLNPDGGYDISIAFKEGTPSQSNIDRIRTSLQIFSSNLWRTTRMHFYIRSVNLLVPEDWTIEASQAEGLSFETADIRVSPTFQIPYVENPNLCGLPGDHIELPVHFFDNVEDQKYGTQWKVLLNQWARYRYGVWEEHGFPKHTIYPYIHKDPTEGWSLTGCSNTKLAGKFKNISNLDFGCDIEDKANIPDEHCRFIPDRVNTAKSSLMHFHWIESVTEFCDEETHNKFAPNRQNLYCNGKSVLEVILESDDFKKLDSSLPAPEIPVIQLNVVKKTSLPLFYFLLDIGELKAHDGLVQYVIPKLSELFVHASESIGALGAFPGEESLIELRVGWKSVKSNLNEFITGLGEIRTDGKNFRDFGLTIHSVTEEIKSLNHEPGAVIFILKAGDHESYDSVIHECEVLSSIAEKNIQLFAIEIQGETLANLATSTGGTHLNIENRLQDTQIAECISSFSNVIQLPIPKNEITTILSKSAVLPNTDYTTRFPTSLQKFYFYLTVDTELNEGDIEIGGETSGFTMTPEWGSNSRWSYSISKDYPDSPPQEIIFKFQCQECKGFFLLRGNNNENEEIVKIIVSTSTSGDYLDASIAPLSIYATVELDEKRVVNLDVVAKVQLGISSSDLELKDDGKLPDILARDGIYSADFYPQSGNDGQHKISVVVKDNPLNKGRLSPIDQIIIDEGKKETVELAGPFEKTVDIPHPILIANAGSGNYRGVPNRVTDLKYLIEDNQVYLIFTSPKIKDFDGKIEEYTVTRRDVDNATFPGIAEQLQEEKILISNDLQFEFQTSYTITIISKFGENLGESSNILIFDGDLEQLETSPPSESTTQSTTTMTTETTTEESTETTTEEQTSTTESSTETSTESSTETTSTESTESSTSTAETTTETSTESTETSTESTETSTESTETSTESTETSTESTETSTESTETSTESTETSTESTETSTESTETSTGSTETSTESTKTSTIASTESTETSTITSTEVPSTTTGQPTITTTSEGSSNPTDSTTEEPLVEPTTKKPWVQTGWGIFTIVAASIVFLVGSSAGFYFVQKKRVKQLDMVESQNFKQVTEL